MNKRATEWFSNPENVEQLVQAIAQVSASNYSANGILINPTDWANIMNTKPTNAAYSLPGSTVVTTDGSLTIAGIPVFQSTAIAADKFLVGDWSMGAQIIWDKIKETSRECAGKEIEVKLPAKLSLISAAFALIGFKL